MSYLIKKVGISEKEDVLAIYNSLKGSYGCTWHEDYPVMENVEWDISTNALYGVYDNGKLIAVATATTDDLPASLNCWNPSMRNACELARIGVIKEYQNHGIAKTLIQFIEADVAKQGFDGIHFLVSKTNPYAIRLYDSLGYRCCGETHLFDIDWFCYEKNL